MTHGHDIADLENFTRHVGGRRGLRIAAFVALMLPHTSANADPDGFAMTGTTLAAHLRTSSAAGHHPRTTGRLASTLRCLDPGCEGMTVEQAVMSEDSFDPRFPQAQQAWRAVWGSLYSQRISADAIRERLVERYGEEILVR